MSSKIYVGVSGGIDSAATVLLLKEKGWDVVGVQIDMSGGMVDDNVLSELLGVPILQVDARRQFETLVVDPFVDSYMRAETPSPCLECNPLVKWAILTQTALEQSSGAQYFIATGHYCNIVCHDSRFYVATGKDPLKDQSYYLWKLPQEILSRAVMPLGMLTKKQVREMMSDRGMQRFVHQRESMGVCFLKEGGPRQIIAKKHAVDHLVGGDIVDRQGNWVGSHDGYPFYTIAQRKGLSLPPKMCVVEILPNENRLVVGFPEELYSSCLRLREWRAVCREELLLTRGIRVKVRGVGENPQGEVYLRVLADGTLEVKTQTPAWSLSKGQPAVFYLDNRVIGGGIVDSFDTEARVSF